jgi:hypothetical protein
MANYSVAAKELPEYGIKAISFEDNYGKAIVSFDDGQERFIEDTIAPFEIADLRELVASRPELLVESLAETGEASEVAEQITYKQADEISSAFVKSEQILDHEIVTSLVARLKTVNTSAASDVMSWHRGRCRERYIATGQQTCCYGDKEEEARNAQRQQFNAAPYRESEWH